MIENLIDLILRHERIVIVTEMNLKVDSKDSLNRLLRLFVNYIGEDNYIEYFHDSRYSSALFVDYLNVSKEQNKTLISATPDVWLTNEMIRDDIFCNAKFILPYRNLLKLSGLPHFPGNRHSIPTKLMHSADLVMGLSKDELTIEKTRYTNYTDDIIDLRKLFLEERNMKVKKLKTLI